ncbi:hypothetical protein DWW27_15105 [Phocaeicola vulgatus]|uniref:Uncharacterized protein n=1 Tax=Phocaeicola vulgatus TaxID=821 RepID=A0A412VJ87_PHOVU|nr:hypothetical protein F9002_10450 [Phocaeicola vulgatus]RGV06484.1 hypothetical protein DWW27_15105 [Phocaeicola vulgatus]
MDPSQKFVYLHCVFHSIRFKVNKRLAVWEDSLFYFILVSPPPKKSSYTYVQTCADVCIIICPK